MKNSLTLILGLISICSFPNAHDNHSVNVYERPTYTAEKSAPQSDRVNIYEMRHSCNSHCGHNYRVEHKHKAKFKRIANCYQSRCDHNHNCARYGCHVSLSSCDFYRCAHAHNCHDHKCHWNPANGHDHHSRLHSHGLRSHHGYHCYSCSHHHSHRKRGRFLGIF